MGAAPKDDTAVALLRRVGQALHRLEREEVCCGEVTRHQFATLRLLESAGGLSTSDVAARLGIDLSTASRNLALLERAGCIRRRASATDARAVRNEVVAKGRACIDTLCCDEQAAFSAVLERVPSRDRPAVLRALSLLAQALDGGTSACCETASTCEVPAAKRTARRSAPLRRITSRPPGKSAR
jgi:DNA-binding MarR family transcriptional regulator